MAEKPTWRDAEAGDLAATKKNQNHDGAQNKAHGADVVKHEGVS